MIGKVFKNRVIRVLFNTKLVQEDNKIETREGDKYQLFNIEIFRAIAKGTAIACCNTSVEENYMEAGQIIVDNRNKYNEKKLLSNSEWEERNIMEAKAAIIYNLVIAVKRNTKTMNGEVVTINNEN